MNILNPEVDWVECLLAGPSSQGLLGPMAFGMYWVFVPSILGGSVV